MSECTAIAVSFPSASPSMPTASITASPSAIAAAPDRKQNLIDFQLDSNNQEIAFYQGKRIIVDDKMPVSAGVYTDYFFGQGAIGYNEGTPKVPSEVERNGLVGGGEEYLISRRHYVMHPRGVKWIGSPAADTPTNAELATAGNWSRVYDQKNIRIVAFKHKNA